MASTIQVDKIQDTGGNTIVESDGSGAATTRIPATYLGSGTASSTTVLYGDQTYKAEPGGVTGIATSMTSGTGINLAVNGEITMPLQPAFLVTLGTQMSNISNSPASFTTVEFDTEVFDQNSDFNTTNYTFTAPVTGRYFIYSTLYLMDADDAASYISLRITTSNRNYEWGLDNMCWDQDANPWSFNGTGVCDMDAADTATIGILQSGGTAQMDIDTVSYVCGYLVC